MGDRHLPHLPSSAQHFLTVPELRGQDRMQMQSNQVRVQHVLRD